MYFVVTVDTEEDEWGRFNLDRFGTGNIKRIPYLQEIFDKYEIRPTYLLTYPVAAEEESVRILSGLAKEGRCEIGTHPHPWNTPPLIEERNERNCFMSNLRSGLQYEKIKNLHDLIAMNFGSAPVSFRSGRWGFSDKVAKNIHELGYKVDTSISPLMDWSVYSGPDFRNFTARPFRFVFESDDGSVRGGNLLEIPPTIGFLQANQEMCRGVYDKVARGFLGRFPLYGLMRRMRLVNKVWLSPETNSGAEMVKLAARMLMNGYKVLNMFFHSSSLQENASPYVKTKADEKEFLKRIEKISMFVKSAGLNSCRLADLYDQEVGADTQVKHRV